MAMTFISNFFDLKDLAIKNNNQTTFDKGHFSVKFMYSEKATKI